AKVESNASPKRQHVPYILNGELYRIENQVGDNVTVRCVYCPPDRIYRGSVRSTGNFHMHIKRRHSSLLGKLHEMKVAALEERRDRIIKNRRFGKGARKPRDATPALQPKQEVMEPVDQVAPIEEVVVAGCSTDSGGSSGTGTHELKIKTVFQRHKQEQEGAASRLSNDSASDNSNKPANSSQIFVLQNVCNPRQMSVQAVATPRTTALFGSVNPEQSSITTYQTDQPAAIDLTRAPSIQDEEMATNNSLSLAPSTGTIEYPRSQAVSQSLSFAHFLENPQRDVLQRLDRTLSDINKELHTRNLIEHNRLMLEIAKFKFLNPNFTFEPPL
ncbi:hypothetical protein KR018_004430, partial [Drosophila ironensis]